MAYVCVFVVDAIVCQPAPNTEENGEETRKDKYEYVN